MSNRPPRDPERIDRMLAKVRQLWIAYPDLRLGQIVVNAGGFGQPGVRAFHVPDEAMERGLDVQLAGLADYGLVWLADLSE